MLPQGQAWRTFFPELNLFCFVHINLLKWRLLWLPWENFSFKCPIWIDARILFYCRNKTWEHDYNQVCSYSVRLQEMRFYADFWLEQKASLWLNFKLHPFYWPEWVLIPIFSDDKECLDLTKRGETVYSGGAQTMDRGKSRQVPWLYLSSKHLYCQTFLNTKCPQINNPLQLWEIQTSKNYCL